MESKIPTVQTATGAAIPIVGLGTWKSKPGEVAQAVKDAISIGYRHIDCAPVYGNEKEVGEGIKAKIEDGTVKRDDLFITSKLWNTFHRPDLVEPSLKKTLSNLALERLDLYLIHWPFGFKEGDAMFPNAPSDADYVDTWKAMEGVCKKGLTKLIGISNFNKKQIERVLEGATIVPATNQVECHPYLTQLKLSEFCKSKGIVLTAYSPLGSPDRPWAKPEDPQLLDDEKIRKIAATHNKTPAQIVLRYQVQRGHVVIPKSVTKSRIEENFKIWDFQLSNEEVQTINKFDCNGRICRFMDAKDHKYYPFHDEY